MLMTHKYPDPKVHFTSNAPTIPYFYFSENDVKERVRIFQDGFDGTVCYAVKCNAHPTIVKAMVASGIEEFDVASPQEIAQIRAMSADLRMNYNNPIRTRDEIAFALEHNVRSFSVDCIEELEKLGEVAPRDCEVSIRLKLNLDGSAYHFGQKFGAGAEAVTMLMKRAAEMGFVVSGTFHVGTQCEKPENWRQYMIQMAECAKEAGVQLARVNVGGGFPAARGGDTPNFSLYFQAIQDGLKHFDVAPALLCEPGRALVADACQYIVQIRSIRRGCEAFLNDGVYGGLGEVRLMGTTADYRLYTPEGEERSGEKRAYHFYGPTCDSVDSIDEDFFLPSDAKEGDYVMFNDAGAYILGLNTRFNGYGEIGFVEVEKLID